MRQYHFPGKVLKSIRSLVHGDVEGETSKTISLKVFVPKLLGYFLANIKIPKKRISASG